MGKELSENTVVSLSLKSIIAIVIALFTLFGAYYTIHLKIEEAKSLPEPIMTKTEYELKDQLIRQTIMDTKSDVDDIKIKLSEIEKKLN